MSHEKSEEMMRLLQELAVLKDMATQEAAPFEDTASRDAQVQRARRRTEIAEEIQQLAEEAKAESD